VLVDKDTEVVAHFKATAIILPNGILKIAGLPLEESLYESDLRIEDEQLAALLKEALKPKKKKEKTEKVEKTEKIEKPQETVKPATPKKKKTEKPAAPKN
jgi:hypothetical protein